MGDTFEDLVTSEQRARALRNAIGQYGAAIALGEGPERTKVGVRAVAQFDRLIEAGRKYGDEEVVKEASRRKARIGYHVFKFGEEPVGDGLGPYTPKEPVTSNPAEEVRQQMLADEDEPTCRNCGCHQWAHSPGGGCTHPDKPGVWTPAVVHPVDAHIAAVCKEAGLGVMVQVYEILSDREQVTEEQLLALTSDQVYSDYENYVGPAIDRIEDNILEAEEASP